MLFIHYFDAHDGEIPGHDDNLIKSSLRKLLTPVDERFGRPFEIRSGYGHRFHLKQVQRIDKQFGRLIGYLQDQSMYEKSLIIVLSDHGDAFGKRGEFNHREYVYNTTIRVPLIAKLPHSENKNVDVQVTRSTDIVPTILDRFGIERDLDGYRLDEDRTKSTAYCETRFEDNKKGSEFKHNYVSLCSRKWKFILDRQTGKEELYNLEDDPEESNNIVASNSDVADQFRSALNNYLKGEINANNNMSASVQSEVSDRLQDLGYL
jgi:arylsulfatase A-like enzyme